MGRILHANPRFTARARARHKWDAGLVFDRVPSHFEDFSPERQPEACWSVCNDGVWREGVQEVLPHVGVH